MNDTMFIANNCTVETGSFCGDQLCALKACYLFIENDPEIKHVIMSMSPSNSLNFVWQKFIDKYNVEVVWDDFHPGDWSVRFANWDKWRSERKIVTSNGVIREFGKYREHYLRIHGAQRQNIICGEERGLNRKNIYEYWVYGQENKPDTCIGSDWFDDTLCYHPELTPKELARDVYIAPHCKTQGNYVFTFDWWADVVHRLIRYGVSVTVGYDGYFCPDLDGHPLYKRHWGNHQEWFDAVCQHKLVACGNTGTGWVAAACGVPMITMEPHNSQMPDHRYRECGLKNIVEVVDGYKLDEFNNDMVLVAEYVARRIVEETKRVTVLTTGCYDILHAGHVRHLERARSLGTRLIVALNSDSSVSSLKGDSRPVNPQNQRKAVLEALRCVNEVVVFDGPNALDLIKQLKPDILACGYGYTEDTIVGKELVESWGGKVVATCKEDASNDSSQPSTTKILQQVKRIHPPLDMIEIVRQGSLYSVNPVSKLRLMAEEFLKVKDLEGDVADLGTYKGGSALILRKLAPRKHLHMFDTWQGTPYDDELCHHKKGEWQASLSDCRKLIGMEVYSYYHPGVFPESIPDYFENGLEPCRFCFVYCDMDTYQSTKDAIQFFWPRIVSGGKMLFDDYLWTPCAGVQKAVDEFSFDNGIKRIVQSQYACIVEKI